MMQNIFNRRKSNKYNLKEMYEEHFNYVYSFVFSRVAGNKEVTEDIVQETFMGVIKGGGEYRGASSYRTWLCGIAKNKILDYYKKHMDKEKFSSLEEIEWLEAEEDVQSFVLHKETKNIIYEVLNKLKPTYKYVLILKYMDDYSVKEIADFLSKTPKAIDGVLQRAKSTFREEYKKLSGEE